MIEPPFLAVPVARRHDGWTPERQWRFVEALGATASVTRAARMVGMSARSAQKLRRHPMAAAFCAAWDAALLQHFSDAEDQAMERVLDGEVVTIERSDGMTETRRRPCSPRLLIRMLDRYEAIERRAIQKGEDANFANL